MKTCILLLAALFAFPAAVVVRADGHIKPAHDETELEGKMDSMGQAWKKLKRQAADATKNAESLQLVATLRTSAEEAAKLEPAKAADVPAADREKFVADYRGGIKKMINELTKLEAALLAGKNDEAAKLIADIGALQKAGHKEFKRPDEKK